MDIPENCRADELMRLGTKLRIPHGLASEGMTVDISEVVVIK